MLMIIVTDLKFIQSGSNESADPNRSYAESRYQIVWHQFMVGNQPRGWTYQLAIAESR